MKETAWIAIAVLCGVIVVGASGAVAAELPPVDQVKPELHATGFVFSEGPAVDSKGNLYVVNYREKGNIGRITPDGTASIFCDLRKLVPVKGKNPQANGLKVDSEGRLVVADAMAGRLLRVSVDGKKVEVLADRWEGNHFNVINDVALDIDGNIFFSDPGKCTPENAVGSIYRYDIKTGKVSRLDTGLAYPNGLGVTPDQKHLCVSESQRYRMLIYDLSSDGKVANRHVLTDFYGHTQKGVPAGKFVPDGLIFDADGRLYVAMFTTGKINVIEVSSGEIVRQYDAGGMKATNCHFHGDYLYTTVAAKEAVFRLKLGVKGFDYNRSGNP